jgi:phosphohistidine phosphatase
VRARDTARLACEALGDEPIVERSLDSGAGVDEAMALLAAAGPDQRVLIVGHNPDFEQIVYDLTGARVEMKKGGVAGIRLSGRGGDLVALLRPRELARIG